MEDSGSALEKNVADLTVMDVYDIAAVVGQEFERIIDQYGCEALSRLMPKVVRVLEILEVMVSRNCISPETEELRLELDKLRLERLDRLEKEKKHRKKTLQAALLTCQRLKTSQDKEVSEMSFKGLIGLICSGTESMESEHSPRVLNLDLQTEQCSTVCDERRGGDVHDKEKQQIFTMETLQTENI
ncbi:RILP-like protein 1 [Nibea albiflora]|uniref:RILP-like protein 1 n=1 Tax=Nibea albiflora TaxID=240163 RepID=A0ACB7F851_NIBAL|nr:RILP-like protein 1 [Nibea albiflora]